jgi:N-acyl-L-homoserine lactone synthetase
MGWNKLELFCIMFSYVWSVSAWAEVAWFCAEIARWIVENRNFGWEKEVCGDKTTWGTERLVASLWTMERDQNKITVEKTAVKVTGLQGQNTE